MNAGRFTCIAAGGLLGLAIDARAQTAPPEEALALPPVATEGTSGVAFGADQVRLDSRSQSLDVAGNVRVDEPPFHLTSEALTLKRVPIGVQLRGRGKVSFCPCLGTPLAIRFSGATVAPPYDLILEDPVLEVFGIPVAWAPAAWLRSPARVGLLPPDVAWRGADGFFAGGGVHVPWQPGDAEHGVDLRAGGYVAGGFAAQTSVTTATTRTRLGWDRLHGDDGLSIDAWGATAAPAGATSSQDAPSVAWQVGALRGARAVRAATDVGEAARPFDRGQAEALLRPYGWTVASRFETVALRGGAPSDLGAAGPVVVVRRSDAVGHAGAYAATLEAGQLAGAGRGATSFARGEGDVGWSARFGALGASLGLHGLGDLANDGERRAGDGAGQARLSIRLPLARSFDSSDPSNPWVHTTEPRVEFAALAARADDSEILPAGHGMATPNGGAWVAAVGWANALGQWGSRSMGDIDASAGIVGNDRQAWIALRGRAAASGPWLSVRADFARVLSRASEDRGGAFVAHARIGNGAGLHVVAHAAERDGVDPLLARALVDPTLEPPSGFLVAPGWTGGLGLGLPLGSRVSARGGADVDLDARNLVSAVGAIELHDPCDCVVVRTTASERIGRGGIDVWISVDLPMAEPHSAVP